MLGNILEKVNSMMLLLKKRRRRRRWRKEGNALFVVLTELSRIK